MTVPRPKDACAQGGHGIVLHQVSKHHGRRAVISALDLVVEPEELLVLLGPSGCGKSTLLRLIAGLDEVTSGTIHMGGVCLSQLPPRQRDIAMVFQNYALYPHMTVAENMSLALKLRGTEARVIAAKVAQVAASLGLSEFLARRPRDLSGGQRQRVAMGRAIVREPKAFLFDEPLSNLDAALRLKMRSEIKELQQRLKTTMIYVTHDQVEAMTLASRIVVLRGGAIEQIGAPTAVFQWPKNLFVAGFIGSPPINLVAGELRQGQLVCGQGPEPLTVALAGADVTLKPGVEDQAVVLGLRPQYLRPRDEAETGRKQPCFAARVLLTEPLGTEMLVHVSALGGRLTYVSLYDPKVQTGDELTLEFALSDLRLFAAASGETLLDAASGRGLKLQF